MIIKNKYIKFVFALVCAFLISDKVNAKTDYTINNSNFKYSELNMVYATDDFQMLPNSSLYYLFSADGVMLTLEETESYNNGKIGFINNIDKQYATCNGVDIPYGVPYIIHNIINLIQIVTPIILIVLGMLDFGKAVVANDEKKMKDASSKFIRRAIAAVIIFFVIAIVKFVFGQVLSDDKGALGCIDCFINNDCDTHE